MIDFSRPMGGIGFSPGVGPLSLSPLGPSPDGFGSLSLGASNYAKASPALDAIARGFGTGRTSSPGGFSGMLGSYGLSAPMLGGLNFAGQAPDFSSPMIAMWKMLNPDPPVRQAGGPAAPSAPQPPAQAAAEAPKKDDAQADAAADPAPAGKGKRKHGSGRPAAPTPRIVAEFQGLYAKYKAAGGDIKKMDPKDAKRLGALAKKYPSLIPKDAGDGDSKKPDAAPDAAPPKTDAAPPPEARDPAAVKAQKLARLHELEKKAYAGTETPAETAELERLQRDPDIR